MGENLVRILLSILSKLFFGKYGTCKVDICRIVNLQSFDGYLVVEVDLCFAVLSKHVSILSSCIPLGLVYLVSLCF